MGADIHRYVTQITMTEIETKNLRILKQRWPDLWATIVNANDDLEIAWIEDGPQSTLIVNGIHLSSCFDRQKEAALQASLIPESSKIAWVYGCGSGDLPRVLLCRENLLALNVVLLNKFVFRESLIYFDHSDWMNDPRTLVYLASSQKGLQAPLCSSSACLRIAELTAESIRDQVVLELATPYINRRMHENKIFKQQIEENREYFDIDADISELFDTKFNATFYVVGAGPTLTDNFDYLKNRWADGILITVDAALKPLLENNIVPDYVLSVDPMRISVYPFLDIEPENMKTISLVYFPVVQRDALKNWQGKRYIACSKSPMYEDVRRIYSISPLFAAGSVLHPAVDLAVKMGAKNIELFGADFSYPKAKSHVSGALFAQNVDGQSVRSWVRNGEGQNVASIPNLIGYLRDLENYIADHLDVNFKNSSREGAMIKGVDYIAPTIP
ncbi:MAG: motility associated factor glycosyltransferase family protein [Thiohalomonadales bacterium]